MFQTRVYVQIYYDYPSTCMLSQIDEWMVKKQLQFLLLIHVALIN